MAKGDVCRIQDCNNIITAKNGSVCSTHNSRKSKYGTYTPVPKACSVKGCTRLTLSKICSTHKRRLNKYGSFELPELPQMCEKSCKNCKKLFKPLYYRSPKQLPVYCTRECKECQSEFTHNIKGKSPIYCSTKCRNVSYDKTHTIANCLVCGNSVLGNKNRNFNKTFCSKCCAGKYRTMGETPKGYRRIMFRHKIINGLEIECEYCKTLDLDLLVVHHIDRNRKNNAIGNLLLLCANCHKKEHNEDSKEMRAYIQKLREAKYAFGERFQQIGDIS